MNDIIVKKDTLYIRNQLGKPMMWEITKCKHPIGHFYFKVSYGIINRIITTEVISVNMKDVDTQYNSLINAKRKKGYKFINELHETAEIPDNIALYSFLDKYLPYNRSNKDNYLLPMLATTFDNTNNKLFNKISNYIGQPKINGLRCFVSAYKNEEDMFNPIKLQFQSREGTIWKSLYDLEEYLLNLLPKELLINMVDGEFILDGEIYLPNKTVNEINHFVKDPNCKENKLLQYWVYDLAINNMIQANRQNYLNKVLFKHKFEPYDKDQHFNNTNRLVLVENETVINETIAYNERNRYIRIGFEGIMLRNPDAEYQFGKRNRSLIKYKSTTDGIFEIVNIVPEGIKRQNIPKLICKNDINNEYFECSIRGNMKYQEEVLKNKELFIGKNVFITYGERSGVNQVPFHIKDVRVIETRND